MTEQEIKTIIDQLQRIAEESLSLHVGTNIADRLAQVIKVLEKEAENAGADL